MHRHLTTALVRALLVAVLAVAGLAGCRSNDQTSPPVQVDQGTTADTPSKDTPEPEEPATDPAATDTDPAGGCAYEGDPACGPYPDDPVPGVCTPDYPGDVACQSNEDLLNDTADINSNNINNSSGW
jgi:hypothetical protein